MISALGMGARLVDDADDPHLELLELFEHGEVVAIVADLARAPDGRLVDPSLGLLLREP